MAMTSPGLTGGCGSSGSVLPPPSESLAELVGVGVPTVKSGALLSVSEPSASREADVELDSWDVGEDSLICAAPSPTMPMVSDGQLSVTDPLVPDIFNVPEASGAGSAVKLVFLPEAC